MLPHASKDTGSCYKTQRTHSEPMAAATTISVWFRVEGAASATSVDVTNGTNIDRLRDKIKEKLADDAKGVPAYKLRISTADGKTYDDPRALVSTLPLDKEFIVTGTFVRAVSVRGSGLWSSQFLWRQPHFLQVSNAAVYRFRVSCPCSHAAERGCSRGCA
jgi:hypothetical protein